MAREPTSILFLKTARTAAASRLLFNQLEDAELIAELAAAAAGAQVLHRRRSLVDLLGANLRQRKSITVEGGIFPAVAAGTYDAAFVHIGPGRAITRAVMTRTFQALRPGGEMFCAGANDAGARSAAKDLADLAPVEVLGHKGGHRLFRAARPHADLITPPDWGQPWERRDLQIEVRGRSYSLRTQPGIFSWEHLDAGTAFLLDAMPDLAPPENAAVLDACCGYGILGLVAEAEWKPASIAWADDDFLAARCAAAAAGDHRAFWMDLAAATPPMPGGYDVILCNPPFHRGHHTDRSFVSRLASIAARALSPGGRLILVANVFLDYAAALKSHFPSIKVARSTASYKIVVAEGALAAL